MKSSTSFSGRLTEWWQNRIIRTKILIGIFVGVLIFQTVSTTYQIQKVERDILNTYKQNALNLSVALDCIMLKDPILFFNLLDRVGRTEVVGIKIDDNHPSCVERDSYLRRLKSAFLAELEENKLGEAQKPATIPVVEEDIEVISDAPANNNLPAATLYSEAAVDLNFDLNSIEGRLEATEIFINGEQKPQLLYTVRVNGVELTFDLTDLPEQKLNRFLFLFFTALGNLLVLFVIIWLLSGRLVAPLKKLTLFAQHIMTSGAMESGGEIEQVATSAKDEIGILSRAISNMMGKLQQSYRQIISSKAAIGDLLDNTGQGFFSFGPDYLIDEEYSKACDLFFKSPISGLNALNLMVPDNQKEVKELTDLLFEGIGDLKLLEDLLPQEMALHRRILALEYRFIKAAGEELKDKMMVILTDITQERELELQLQKDEELNELIIKIARDRDGFVQFVQETCRIISKLISTLNDPSAEKDPVVIMRDLHTIKGVSATYGLKKVAELAHHIEDRVQESQSNNDFGENRNITILVNFLADLKEVLKDSLQHVEDIITWDEIVKSSDRIYKVNESKVRQLESLFSNASKVQRSRIIQALHSLRKEPIQPVFRKYASNAENLAEKLGKQVQVKQIGADTEVFFQRLEPLFDVLIHLVRNSVDHGLESNEERKRSGKPGIGTLVLSAAHKEQYLILSISDDGGGVDTGKVKKVAVKKGIITQEESEQLDQKEAIKLLFRPGFSTSESVSDISGRGVGMDAVKSKVQELGGTIAIKTIPGKGTTFRLKIPDHV
jgi:two-component system, chemotaxis family, sensor kinase CheA